MAFDVAGARAAGYSDAEIQGFLQQAQPQAQPVAAPAAPRQFDVAGARAAGYSDAEIQQFMQRAAPAAPNPTEGMGAGERFIAGVGGGMTDVGQGVRQLMAAIGPANYERMLRSLPLVGTALGNVGDLRQVGEFLDPEKAQAAIDEKRRLDAPLQATTAGALGNVAGRIAATAPLAMALPASTVAAAAGTGALMGGLDPVATGESRSTNILAGALGGGVGGAVVKGLSRIVSPRASTDPRLQQLLAEGVTPTPGRFAGEMASRFEDATASTPFIGDIVRKGQAAVNAEFNHAAFNRVLEPLGAKLKPDAPIGHDTVDTVASVVSRAYDNLLAQPGMAARADSRFMNDLVNIRMRNVGTKLPTQQAQRFDELIDSLLLSRFKPGAPAGPRIRPHMEITGDALKQAEADLGVVINTYKKGAFGDDKLLGEALQDVQGAFRAAISRANPQYADELRRVNTAFAQLTRVENAALRNAEGVLTPASLQAAVKAADTSGRRHTAVAHGKGLMQDLAKAGGVLRQTEPNSGTPYRMAVEGLLLGGAVAINPAILYALPAVLGAYSKTGRKAFAALMAKRPQEALVIAEQLVRRGTPLAATAGAQNNLGGP